MSYVKLIYHIVFGTKERERTISVEHERELYAFMLSVVQRYKGYVHRINGMPDHVHLLVELPAQYALAQVVKDLKQGSSVMMKENPNFPDWRGWAEGYAAFTYSKDEIPTVKKYIVGQKEHHKKVSFAEEYRDWLIENGFSEDAPFFPKL